jgi:hypothetical protein
MLAACSEFVMRSNGVGSGVLEVICCNQLWWHWQLWWCWEQCGICNSGGTCSCDGKLNVVVVLL